MKDPIFRAAVQWYGRLAGFLLALALVFAFVNLSQGQSGTGTVDSVTTLLRKPSATAVVQWEVTANGVNRSGTF